MRYNAPLTGNRIACKCFGILRGGCEGVTIRTKDRVFSVWLMGDDEGGGWFEWKNGMEMELSDERRLQTSEGFGGRRVRNIVLNTQYQC